MRFLLLFSLFLALFVSSNSRAFAQTLLERNQELARRALERLDSFHKRTPAGEESSRRLHVVYWTPADREPAKDYRQRLSRILSQIQGFYAAQLEANGFGKRTITLDRDAKDRLKIHVVKGHGNTNEYGKPSGARIRQECVPVLRAVGIDADRETILIFCNLGFWDETSRRMRHQSPYYAGGDNASGTAWQLDEPILDTLRLTDSELMFDGEYGRISMGKHNSIFIGGVAHELGHALGLPHNKERIDERVAFGTALMGSGNRTYGDELRGEGKGSFMTFASALRLASHPQFSGSTRAMNQPVRAQFPELVLETTEQGFRVRGRVISGMPIYGIVAYTDPDGGSDYDATTQCSVPDEAGRFSIDCEALERGKKGELRLLVCHVNGKVSSDRFRYVVPRDGSADLSESMVRLQLRPFVAALRDGDRRKAEAVADQLPDRPRRIAQRVLVARFGSPPTETPAEIADSVLSIGLTDTRPKYARVGWIGPRYDSLPDDGLVISAGDRLFERGIYAHAEAEHRYQLGGKWGRLKGQVGVATGHPGSVVFVVSLDGAELWRSEMIQEGILAAFDVDVARGGELKLRVEDGGNGGGADWGVWLNPRLER